MEWKEFLLMLHLATTKFCQEQPKQFTHCYELVKDCVLDGEKFSWCIEAQKKHVL